MSSLRRCTRPLAPALLAGLLVIAAAPAPAVGYDDAGYLAYADRMQERLDRLWDERRGLYRPGEGGADALINASLLLTHSVAAHAGHRGPTRNDARARSIAKALVSFPVFIERPAARPPSGSQPHAPGWTSAMYDAGAPQHVMIDAQIVDALVHAWQARRELGLPARTVRLIRDRIHRRGALLVLALAAAPAQPDQLVRARLCRRRHGYRRPDAAAPRPAFAAHAVHHRSAQLRRRAALPIRAAAAAGAPANVDSAEYSNIVLSFLRFYVQARRAGMAPLPPTGRALVRRWIRRAIAGYWTHGGYLNWDTGLGFERWHLGKKYGLAQQALIGDRADAAAAAGALLGAVGEVNVRPRPGRLRAAARDGDRPPGPRAVRPLQLPAEHGRRAADRRPTPSERRPRGRGRARAACAARPRRRCMPSTPTSGGSRSPRRRTTPRSSRSMHARSRTAGSNLRGCSMPTRTSLPTSAGARLPRSGCSSARPAARPCSRPRRDARAWIRRSPRSG